MKINIHIHTHPDGETKEKLNLIIHNQKKIMATISELQQQVTDLNTKADALQSALDNEQSAIAQVLADLNQRIADLQAIIDAGGGATAEQLQTLSDGIKSATDKLSATQTDLEGTV